MQSPKRIYIHDDWNPLSKSFDADVSLLEFEDDSIIFNNFVQPICLWNSKNEPTVTEGTVTGWGKSEDTTNTHEIKPKVIKVHIQTNEHCLSQQPRLSELSSERTFCAGLTNGSGVCFGDSGGGLFIENNGVYHLKGIVSSSLLNATECDVFGNAIYTNLIMFRDWIENVTGGDLFWKCF